MDAIIDYLIQKGGIWGVMFAMSIAWMVFREKISSDKDKLHVEEMKTNSKQLHDKISDINKSVESFKGLTSDQARALEKLQNQLNTVHDHRIDELKEILQEYSKSMNDLSFALEKINYILEMKLREGK